MITPASRLTECRLWTPDEMKNADQAAVCSGISIEALIDAAGRQVARAILERYPDAHRIAAIAGKGNNGLDALAAVERLRDAGRTVRVFSAGLEVSGTETLEDFDASGCDLILDGLLGAGLDRDVKGIHAAVIEAACRSGVPIVAIDMPSGVDGRTGEIRGVAVRADLTVTFVMRKPGHLLLPGRDRCGTILVADLPMPAAALGSALREGRPTFANEPDLWRAHAAGPLAAHHKYDRGHAVVFSGPMTQTGAARLAAMAALRGGAGLVTVFSPPSALMVNAHHLTSTMLKRCEPGNLSQLLEDKRLNAFVLGPGFGVGEWARQVAGMVLSAGRRLVLDADGLTSFQDQPEALFTAAAQSGGTEPQLVLTPHTGEFARLFPDLAGDTSLSKVDRARLASERSGAVVVLKGADTVIAAPDGRAAINATGTPWLATAGTGDVLAGIIVSQLAQGVPSFEAACLGVWMHGRAAEHFGPGLISEDLSACLPAVHRDLQEIASGREGGRPTRRPPP